MKEIILNGKYGKDRIALVDNEDFERVSKIKWSITNTGYAAKSGKFLQHFIMNWTSSRKFYLDHINGNKLDNRKSNLRIVTPKQNNWNSKRKSLLGYRGVTYTFAYLNGKKYIRKLPYLVAIGNHKNYKYIGYFATAIQAAMAYDIWAKEWYGEYAKLNFSPLN